jgi:hypothetical protein
LRLSNLTKIMIFGRSPSLMEMIILANVRPRLRGKVTRNLFNYAVQLKVRLLAAFAGSDLQVLRVRNAHLLRSITFHHKVAVCKLRKLILGGLLIVTSKRPVPSCLGINSNKKITSAAINF